ncbi:recombinase family protein [Ensifer sp. SL37]|uniref:recombinase family protein n=1 Tax=Ensifer sp. SL37 TaxID=2995137 RepID=UPI002272AC97|nr:recombinase family protein [Ensifer sp. SL37]MCY1740892.1 recombinase family protein [Ensifer sp. SL37]
MKLGYARVSTDDQSLEVQQDRLAAVGCERVFEEKISGAVRGRPALEKVIEHLRKDDVLVVTRLDRLARSTIELGSVRNSVRWAMMMKRSESSHGYRKRTSGPTSCWS